MEVLGLIQVHGVKDETKDEKARQRFAIRSTHEDGLCLLPEKLSYDPNSRKVWTFEYGLQSLGNAQYLIGVTAEHPLNPPEEEHMARPLRH